VNMIPFIIDSEAGCAPRKSVADSVLMLPLGVGTVLDHLIDRLEGLHRGEIQVWPAFSVDADYEDCLQSNRAVAVNIIHKEKLDSIFEQYETSDYLLIFEAGNWLMNGLDAVGLRRSQHNYRGATHAIAFGVDSERACERIACDDHGHVKCVQRLYNMKNWPELAGHAIAYTIVPAHALLGIHFTSLGELREGLASRGVLSRDLPVRSEILNLSCEPDFLALNERVLLETTSKQAAPGFSIRSPGILIGQGCRIHPSVRLVAPIIVQPNTILEQSVKVVGPTLVGSGCRVRRGAVIAQSVLRDGTVVYPNITVRRRVLSGRCVESVSDISREKPILSSISSTGIPRFSGEGTIVLPQGNNRAQREGKIIQRAIKRTIDFVLSALALTVLSPLLIVVAILIKLESRGPVFFCHHRETRKGKEFACVKFRTMVSEAHNQQLKLYKDSLVDGPQFKIDNDPRVTRLGRWLRATNIDELPQLFNVLVGHMSLVGPRPSPFRENQICVPWRRARLSVRPGITGLWQICRNDDRARGGFHEWIYYDTIYTRYFSLWLDLKIVVATFATLGGRKSVPFSRLVRPSKHSRNGSRQPSSSGIYQGFTDKISHLAG